MKAMVLAAGKGTRLFPLTGRLPKPMAPVAGKPIIHHIFERLADSGIEESHVNAHHLADAILDRYGEKSRVGDMEVNVSYEEKLLGTAGGVKRLAGRFDDTFVVVMGDALTDVDVREVVEFHKEKNALATIALKRVADTSEYGVVELDAEKNIRSFQEKPEPGEAISDLANTGIYVLEPEVLRYIPDDTFFDFAKDVFPRLLASGVKFTGYDEGDFYWSDVGTLEAYRTAQRDVLAGNVRVKIPGEKMGRWLWVHPDAHFHKTVSFEGQSVLGRDVVVGRGVTLSGDVTLGRGCWVHPGAVIKRSILLPGATVGEGAHLEDCITRIIHGGI